MRLWVIYLAICGCVVAQCNLANIAAGTYSCGNPGYPTGDVSGSSPTLTALAAASYSSNGNAAARIESVVYKKSLGTSDKSQPILVYIHGNGFGGGGPYGFNVMGDPSSGSAMAGQYAPIFGGSAGTIVNVNYTQYTASLGTAAPMPTPLPEILCAFHSVAHFAGTTFPGNPMQMKVYGLSAGGWLSKWITWGQANITPNCEYSDAFAVVAGVDTSGGYQAATECAAGAGDSSFTTAINGEYVCSCNGTTNCNAAGALYDPSSIISAGKAPYLTIEGASDPTIVPQYNGAQMMIDGAAIGANVKRIVVTGVHGADMLSPSGLFTKPGYQAFYEHMANRSGSAGSTGSGGAGGSM